MLIAGHLRQTVASRRPWHGYRSSRCTFFITTAHARDQMRAQVPEQYLGRHAARPRADKAETLHFLESKMARGEVSNRSLTARCCNETVRYHVPIASRIIALDLRAVPSTSPELAMSNVQRNPRAAISLIAESST